MRSPSFVRFAARTAFAALLSLACSASAGSDVSQDALLRQIESPEPPLVLDVRTPGEFASGRVPGAVNVPVNEVAQRIEALAPARDRDIVVYCEKGPRARAAQATLQGAGFTSVRHLEGDMSAWRRQKLPCEGC